MSLLTHVYAARNLRFHPHYDTPRDKQRTSEFVLVPDNSRLRELEQRIRNARILEPVVGTMAPNADPNVLVLGFADEVQA